MSTDPTEPHPAFSPPPELDAEQELYESLFGRQDEWHRHPAAPTPPPTDDDDLYAALFGGHPITDDHN